MRILSLAKINSMEILIEEQLQYVGSYQSRFFENYKKNKENLRKKELMTKIISSVMFTILPIIPLLAYIQINNQLMSGTIPSEVVVFTGSLLFAIYFSLQFFNFFLLGMFNTTMIISGRIFKWYETLPLPRESLRKMVFFTIFRSLDLPILISLIAFPTIILIGTLNITMFFICFGVGILNTLFAFSLLIFSGVRLNRILDINDLGSQKTNLVRLFHMFSYLFIIIVSVYSIQFSFSSIESIFNWFISIDSPSMVNSMLSLIPFPFNLSYIVALFISPEQVPFELWLNSIIGLAIFILLTWLVYGRTLKSLEKVSFSKYSTIKRQQVSNTKKKTRLRVRSPIQAYIRKDLITSSRDIKTLMSFIMPIILSYIFTLSYNLAGLSEISFLESTGIYDWLIYLGFQVVVAGMIVFSLLNIEESGETILASLPIIPRERARAKLLLMTMIQIISVLTPPLFLLNNEKFFSVSLISLWTLPFASIFLLSFFLLRVHYFGKMKNHYVLEEVLQEKKTTKWAIIYLSNIFIFIWIFTIGLYIHNSIGFLEMILFFVFTIILGFTFIILIFESMFPKIKIKKEEKRVIFISNYQVRETGTWLTQHMWESFIIMLVFYYIFGILANYIIGLNPPLLEPFYNATTAFLFILSLGGYNLIYSSFFFLIIPKVFGFPFGKKSLTQYFDDIGMNWFRKFMKYLIRVLPAFIGIYSINIILYTLNYSLLSFPILIPYYFFDILLIISKNFWQEIALRGIIMSKLLKTRKQRSAIIYGGLISSIFNLVPLFTTFIYLPNAIFPILILWVYLFVVGLILSYLFAKTNNLIPGLILNMVLAITGQNFFPSVLII
jgi:hypothetical protein